MSRYSSIEDNGTILMDSAFAIRTWQQLIQRAWREPPFLARLVAEPAQVLTEAGIPVPPGLQLTLLQDTPTTRHLVLDPPVTTERNTP
jgi:hypothetical protein